MSTFKTVATVHQDSLTTSIKCSCRMFSSFRIPCCYIICTLTTRRIADILSCLIMDLWRATRRCQPAPTINQNCHSEVLGLHNLCNEISHLIDQQSSSMGYVLESLKAIVARLKSDSPMAFNQSPGLKILLTFQSLLVIRRWQRPRVVEKVEGFRKNQNDSYLEGRASSTKYIHVQTMGKKGITKEAI